MQPILSIQEDNVLNITVFMAFNQHKLMGYSLTDSLISLLFYYKNLFTQFRTMYRNPFQITLIEL
jgi:hypothetical protein